MLKKLLSISRELSDQVDQLEFSKSVAYVYNPLSYAWAMHEAYLKKYAASKKRVLFMGMNPGPFGMTQTAVPFGECGYVREWLKLDESIRRPEIEHPKRPVEGLNCKRSEVSGRRLWGLFSDSFGTADNFFQDNFVISYCPLLFLEESGRNLTPDKIKSAETEELFRICDEYVFKVVDILKPEHFVAVGKFAEKRAKLVLSAENISITPIIHPSPANPSANKDWAEKTAATLFVKEIWEKKSCSHCKSS